MKSGHIFDFDDDLSGEGELLQMYTDAALEARQKHIGKRFEDGLEFTPAMRVGCLMYIAFLYENREAVSPVEQSELPMAISALWSVYRDVGCTDAVATIKAMH